MKKCSLDENKNSAPSCIYNWFKKYRSLSKNPEKLEVMSKFCENYIEKYKVQTDPKSSLILRIFEELIEIINTVKESKDIEYSGLNKLAREYMRYMDMLRMILFYEKDENGEYIFNVKNFDDFVYILNQIDKINTEIKDKSEQLILRKK